MSASVAISVLDLWKLFRFHHSRARSFKEALVFRLAGRRETRSFWALRDVTLRIPKGACWGIIGGNGSGKTTLFRILSGVMAPDRGTVVIDGTVSPVVDLMAGFNEDLTGFENIRLGLTLHALTPRTAAFRAKEVLEFAELGEFVHMPLRHYSSGMMLRLGFALAVCVDADVLLIDEVLAVGDLGFQTKCLEKIREFRGRGKTIAIISHDLGQLESVCDHAVWLSGGAVRRQGEPPAVIADYRKESLLVPPETARAMIAEGDAPAS